MIGRQYQAYELGTGLAFKCPCCNVIRYPSGEEQSRPGASYFPWSNKLKRGELMWFEDATAEVAKSLQEESEDEDWQRAT